MLNKLETLVKTWDIKTLKSGIKRHQQEMSDLRHEWMGTSRELAKFCKAENRCNILIAELKTR